jgi:hypothetical protein
MQFTEDLAKTSTKLADGRYPAAKKKEWADFDDFFSDPREDVDGTWLSVIDANAEANSGRYGVFCEREGTWKPLYVPDWGIRYADDTYDVLTDDEFAKRYNTSQETKK